MAERSQPMAKPNPTKLPLVIIMFASYTLGCVAWLVLVFFAGRGEAAWIRVELADEVTAGVVNADQARACGRYRSRVAARWAALRDHGFGRAHQLGRLYCLGAELAFKKRQLAIHSEETKNVDEIVRLREEIRQVRDALAEKNAEAKADVSMICSRERHDNAAPD